MEQPAHLNNGAFFSALPPVSDINIPSATAAGKRVKREHELGIYADLIRRADTITAEWLHTMSKRWLQRRATDEPGADASREARSLGHGSRDLPPLAFSVCIVQGSQPRLVNAVNKVIHAKAWLELGLLLQQMELWHSVMHRAGAERPWWELEAAAQNAKGQPAELVHIDVETETPATLYKRVAQLVRDEASGCDVHMPRTHEHEGTEYKLWTWNRVKRCAEGLISVELPGVIVEVPGVGMVELEEDGVVKRSMRWIQDHRDPMGGPLIRVHPTVVVKSEEGASFSFSAPSPTSSEQRPSSSHLSVKAEESQAVPSIDDSLRNARAERAASLAREEAQRKKSEEEALARRHAGNAKQSATLAARKAASEAAAEKAASEAAALAAKNDEDEDDDANASSSMRDQLANLKKMRCVYCKKPHPGRDSFEMSDVNEYDEEDGGPDSWNWHGDSYNLKRGVCPDCVDEDVGDGGDGDAVGMLNNGSDAEDEDDDGAQQVSEEDDDELTECFCVYCGDAHPANEEGGVVGEGYAEGDGDRFGWDVYAYDPKRGCCADCLDRLDEQGIRDTQWWFEYEGPADGSYFDES